MAAPHAHCECPQACAATSTNQSYDFGVFSLLIGKQTVGKLCDFVGDGGRATAEESVADLGPPSYDGFEAAREAARRVVKGDISPSTTTLSAWFKLNYDGYDQDGARGERLSSDGRDGGSFHDASS
jgi:hypothetical protein